ncbi:unnamed protein product, partial [Mesorhabditis spiculigera]
MKTVAENLHKKDKDYQPLVDEAKTWYERCDPAANATIDYKKTSAELLADVTEDTKKAYWDDRKESEITDKVEKELQMLIIRCSPVTSSRLYIFAVLVMLLAIASAVVSCFGLKKETQFIWHIPVLAFTVVMFCISGFAIYQATIYRTWSRSVITCGPVIYAIYAGLIVAYIVHTFQEKARREGHGAKNAHFHTLYPLGGAMCICVKVLLGCSHGWTITLFLIVAVVALISSYSLKSIQGPCGCAYALLSIQDTAIAKQYEADREFWDTACKEFSADSEAVQTDQTDAFKNWLARVNMLMLTLFGTAWMVLRIAGDASSLAARTLSGQVVSSFIYLVLTIGFCYYASANDEGRLTARPKPPIRTSSPRRLSWPRFRGTARIGSPTATTTSRKKIENNDRNQEH